MALPERLWIAEVSTTYPGATLRLLSAVPLDERSLQLGEVYATDPEAVTTAIRDHPDVLTHERLHGDGDRVLSKYETRERSLFEFLGSTSLLPEYPLSVEDGEMTFAVTATQAEFEAFGDHLDASGLQYELVSVLHRDDPEDVLTPRQRECLTVARRMGYFEVPRDTTLAAVADALDVDTSTASETLRRAVARVLDRFFLEDRGSARR
jgi:predicted DNA binding protein